MTTSPDTSRPAPPPPPKKEDVEVTLSSTYASVKAAFATAGEISQFAAQTFRELPRVRMYSAEVFRQCGILILASGPAAAARQQASGEPASGEPASGERIQPLE